MSAVLPLALFLYCACGVPTTSSCPNCVGGGKPVYYNKQKARDAKRIAKRADKRSTVGGTTLPDPIGVETKKAKHKKKKGEKTIGLENEPIM